MAVSRESIDSVAGVIKACISEQRKQVAHLLLFSGLHMHVKLHHFARWLTVSIVCDIVCVIMFFCKAWMLLLYSSVIKEVLRPTFAISV